MAAIINFLASHYKTVQTILYVLLAICNLLPPIIVAAYSKKKRAACTSAIDVTGCNQGIDSQAMTISLIFAFVTAGVIALTLLQKRITERLVSW